MPFAHPLYVLFSSGTTGLPKAIVHGHGGILLEHLKNLGLAWDVRPGDRLQWFTTTAWMMWNALVSTLLLRASIVMLDGNPGYPDLGHAVAAGREDAADADGHQPRVRARLPQAGHRAGPAVRPLLAPLAHGRRLAARPWTASSGSTSRSTRACSSSTAAAAPTSAPGIVQGCPLLPVYAGEIAGPCLGVDVAAFDERGEPIVGALGELVIRQPMPSMAVGFWNDPDGARYRAAYFDHYPGVWRHGDWIMFTERGSCVITGRSDATLNRGGVRLGTSELYSVVEDLDDVVDSLVVHLEEGGRAHPVRRPARGPGARRRHAQRIAGALRDALSPRHVPDTIVALPVIPQTLTGQEARAAGQADPRRRPRGRGGQPGRARESRLDRARHRLREHAPSARRKGVDEHV